MRFGEFNDTIGTFEEEVTTIELLLSPQPFKKLHSFTFKL
jgi:hypothetical protein